MNIGFIWTLIGLLILLAAIVIAGSFYFYRKAVARVSKSFLKADPGLQANPDIERDPGSDKNWWDAQPFQIMDLTAEDGLKLKAYYLSAAEPTTRTVILAHGYAREASIMVAFARLYHEKYGFNILLPDARGHGASEGRYIGFGWHERLDYVKWIQFMIDRQGTESRIMLHGVSMGAATVMMTSGEQLPDQVKCIVEDCGYTSAEDELSYQLRRMYHLPAFPLLQTTSLLTKLRAGYSFAEASALKQVEKNSKPMLFIHGGKDVFVPTSMVYKLYASCRAEKQMLLIPEAGHGDAFLTDPQAYKRELTAFIGTRMD
ncbi:alpha/beta hydrolase [Paenibacillus nasutitermitis]|uniref:Peptidase S9 prolyl oligopeptidase catalytic domain-containing protein n=1 Tax=Paenibacillus nasutitermitis TaxID=1652958 RepID=A0A917DSN2_9BACL|nr:alpha/beta hydrolase [Paenibacillus nasutitermitis]GGD63286.1 hypothetical protein GCM10010911_21320 [Paenibacillus nasutitermitis]